MSKLKRAVSMTALAGGVCLAAMSVSAQGTQPGPTLAAVKQRDLLHCGVNTGLAGFSIPDQQGKWTGLDVDVCKAVAAAVLGTADKVRYFPTNAQQRFPLLQAGEIDILSRNTTWTLTRDTALGLDFAPVTFYDGQGFIVPAKLGVKSAKELGGATVCVQPGTTTELNLTDYFRANKLEFKPVVISELAELEAAFVAGRCDAYTTDRSGLASFRASRSGNPDAFVILPETISKEPLAPAVRQGDSSWTNIVAWTVYALIEAEELGITQANIDEMKAKSDNPNVKRLLGVTGNLGKAVLVEDDFAYKAIKAVGNYGEIFERNVGKGSSLKMDRGQNQLWTKGGLMYAMPFR